MSKDRAAWASTTVSQIAEKIFDGPFGSNLKSGDYVSEGARVVRLENIGHLCFFDEKRTYVTLEKYESLKKHSLHTDDILFSSFVDEEVRVCLFPRDPNVPTINKADCFCIRVNRAVCDPRWLACTLACKSTYERLREAVHGATRPRVNLSVLKSLRLDLPPLAEQRRIVAKFDSLSRKSKRAREQLDHIPRLVERYKQAVLAAAFSGELTSKWRIRYALPELGAVRLGQLIADPIRNGLSVRGADEPPGVRSLKLSALRSDIVDMSDVRYLPITQERASRFLLREGDLLISRGNGTKAFVGLAALVGVLPAPTIFPDTAFRVRLDTERARPSWLARIWNSPPIRLQIESAAKTTAGIWKVAQSDLNTVSILLPDPVEQDEIVHRIERAFKWVDRLAADATSARKLIDHLDQGILAKAFRGELVPQDPGDEPASALLDRIRSERAAGAEKVRKRGRLGVEGSMSGTPTGQSLELVFHRRTPGRNVDR